MWNDSLSGVALRPPGLADPQSSSRNPFRRITKPLLVDSVNRLTCIESRGITRYYPAFLDFHISGTEPLLRGCCPVICAIL